MSRMVMERRHPVTVNGHGSCILRFRRLISRRSGWGLNRMYPGLQSGKVGSNGSSEGIPLPSTRVPRGSFPLPLGCRG